MSHVPFVSTVVEALSQKKDGRIGKDFLLDILDEHFSDSEAERQFVTLVDWGRNTTPKRSGSIRPKKR